MNTLYRYEINYKTTDNETDIFLRKYPVISEGVIKYYYENK